VFSPVCGQSPVFKRIDWPFSFGNKVFQSVRPAADDNLWLLASSSESGGQQGGGQLAKILPGGQLTEARVLKSSAGQEVSVLDFCESDAGEKYALVFTDESPAPSVVQNGRLFVVKFGNNWQQIWSRELKGNGATSSQFSKIQVDDSGLVYCFFFDGNYAINCIQPNGDLLWSKVVESGIQLNGLSGTIIGDFVLDLNGTDLTTTIYAPILQETFFLRLKRSNGALLTGVRLPGHVISDVLSLPGNQTLAVCFPGTDYATRRFVLLDANLSVIRAWEYNDPRFFLHQMVEGRDSTFFVFADGFSASCVFHMDNRGTLLKGVQMKGLDDFSTRTRGLALDGGAMVALPASLEPGVPGGTALLILDESLSLDDCPLIPFCADIRALDLSVQPFNPVLSSVSLLASDFTVFWQNIAVNVTDYCPLALTFNGVSARFSSPDTVCTGAGVSIEGLANGGASAWFWSFPGAQTDSSNAQQPGPLTYNVPGIYSIRQITISECGADTFQKTITVIPAPSVLLPPSQTFCTDTTLILDPQLDNATAWSWQDFYPDRVRPAANSGTYILTASNLGYCAAADTTILQLIRLNAAIDIPPAICTNEPVLLIAPPNPEGSLLRWDVVPAQPGLPVLSDTFEAEWTNPGLYTLELRIENSICADTARVEVEVFSAPEIDLGSDFRLKDNQSVLISPGVRPPQSVVTWADGFPTPEREIDEPGSFLIKATLGICEAIDTLVVFPPLRIYQPNVFRPGSLGNDFFTVFTGDGDQVENLQVYDRWGSLVFTGAGFPGWDGRLPDGRLPDNGVFVYKATIRLAEGRLMEVSGDVTLLR
jgi:PKD repeat protein